MRGERILTREFEKINHLKIELVSRGQRSHKEIVNEIKEVTEDLEAILVDLGYLNDESDEINIEDRGVRTYRCFRENAKFTLEDLEKYNGKDGKPLYLAIQNNVYDLSELIENREDNNLQDLIDEIKCNEELLQKYVVVGTLVDNRWII